MRQHKPGQIVFLKKYWYNGVTFFAAGCYIGERVQKQTRKEADDIEGDAFQLLYQKYRNAIYLYLYSMCHNTALAEDLTQDAFVKALLALPEGHGNVKAWLYTVARNLYLNYQKREQRNASWDEAQYLEDLSEDGLLARMICSETNALLFRGINQLSPNKREILQLQYFGGLSQNEIGAVLGLTAANVRVLAMRAKRELKCYLEENGYEFS